MLLRLLAACANEPCTIAVLCKAAVARRVMERCAVDQQDVDGSLWGIDTKRHFDASVEAALLVMKTRPGRRATLDLAWPVFADLTSVVASGRIGVVGVQKTQDLEPRAHIRRRSRLALGAQARLLAGDGAHRPRRRLGER